MGTSFLLYCINTFMTNMFLIINELTLSIICKGAFMLRVNVKCMFDICSVKFEAIVSLDKTILCVLV